MPKLEVKIEKKNMKECVRLAIDKIINTVDEQYH